MGKEGKRPQTRHDEAYKVKALELVREVGVAKASKELGVPVGTLSGWKRNAEMGRIDTGAGTQTPESALTQAAEIARLTAEVKALKKQNAEQAATIEILAEATSFFAASRQKSVKKNE